MSEKSFNLIPDAVNDAAKNITELPTKSIGTTIADCWYLIFGGLSQLADKRRVKYSIELEHFKKELQESLEKVPDNNKQEPSTQIVMSALDDARYCVEEEELRKLFVNLISSSTDSSKTVHPSFSHIIRQMSQNDAKILREFIHTAKHPLCNLKLSSSDGGFRYINTNMFIPIYHAISDNDVSVSISSLVYLGLLEIPSDRHFKDLSLYEPFKESDQYLSACKIHPTSSLELEHKIVQLTSLGKLFMACCVTN